MYLIIFRAFRVLEYGRKRGKRGKRLFAVSVVSAVSAFSTWPVFSSIVVLPRNFSSFVFFFICGFFSISGRNKMCLSCDVLKSF